MKLIIFSLFLALCPAVHGCIAPKTGAEYDRLILVSGPDEQGFYRVSLPRKIHGYKHDPEIEVKYASVQPSNISAPPFPPQTSYERNNGNILVSLPASQIGDLHVYVSVYWPPNSPGMCGVHAISRTIGKNA